MDDVISTIFLSKIRKNIVLIRIPTIDEKLNIANKIVYDIGGGEFDHHQKIEMDKEKTVFTIHQ